MKIKETAFASIIQSKYVTLLYIDLCITQRIIIETGLASVRKDMDSQYVSCRKMKKTAERNREGMFMLKTKILVTAVLVFSIVSIAFCDSVHLLNGGKINGEITGHTEDCFIIQVGSKNYLVEKNNVIYTVAKINTAENTLKFRKSLILPYVYPYNDLFEIGLYLTF